ncbi:MAG: hypothetical protein IKC01_09780 [Clostridia bacterium]|nr:hypothetical protein [Clostridia bacterium]
MEQRFKIFIAYHTNEENIAILLSEYFQNMGIQKEFIYLCALPSNDGKVNNIEEINAMVKSSCVNIPILSMKFLESVFCTNLTGAMIFDEEALLLPVILPEINQSMIYGFMKDVYKLFKLDISSDVAYIYDVVQGSLNIAPPSLSVATNAMNTFINKYTVTVNRITSKTSPTLISSNPAFEQLDITTDDEMIILYYILSNQVLEVSKKTIEQWLVDEELYDVDVENAFKLLATIGYARYHDGALKIDIITFRRWSKMTEELLPVLSTCVKNHRILSSDIFEDMWYNEELNPTLKMFTAYLIDENVTVLTNKSSNDQQLQDIKDWENKNGFPNAVSANYQKCLQVFNDNNLIYESEWSIHGTPRKYNLNNSFASHILSSDFRHRNEIAELKESLRRL